jgi:hypothetical protein
MPICSIQTETGSPSHHRNDGSKYGTPLRADNKQQAINDLINIAFYFLLRVGEYTYTSKKAKTRTIQFRVQDITFWGINKPIPNTAPLNELLKADAVTLKISNQKRAQEAN